MIANKLIFEPLSGRRWIATGALGDCYWADDNGLWDSDPDNSGPDEGQRLVAQAKEEKLIRGLLNPDALAVLDNQPNPTNNH